MKTMKKLMALLLSFVMILGMLPVQAFATETTTETEPTIEEPLQEAVQSVDVTVLASGTCGAYGDDVSWSLSEDGIMTISGTGRMASYNSASGAPWHSHRSAITSLVVEEGVTGINQSTFAGLKYVHTVQLPSTLTKMLSIKTMAPTMPPSTAPRRTQARAICAHRRAKRMAPSPSQPSIAANPSGHTPCASPHRMAAMWSYNPLPSPM